MNGIVGFDWNKNGKTDAFDHYMNMKAVEEVSQNCPDLPGRKPEITGISMGGKLLYNATKDSSGVVILKSLLVLAICFGGIALAVAVGTEMPLFQALFLLGSVGLGAALLKNI